MIEIKVHTDVIKSGGGVRQDLIRKYLHSNGYGRIHQFFEDEISWSMTLFVSNTVPDVLTKLSDQFPMYKFEGE